MREAVVEQLTTAAAAAPEAQRKAGEQREPPVGSHSQGMHSSTAAVACHLRVFPLFT